MTLAFRPILHERTGADDDRRRVHPAGPEAAPHVAREDARRAHARAAPHGAGGPPEGEHDRVDPLAPRAHGGQRRALRAPDPPADGLAGGRLRGDARPAARRAGHRHADGRGAGAPPQGPGALPRVRAEGVGEHRRVPDGDAGGRARGHRDREAVRRDAGRAGARLHLPHARDGARRGDRRLAHAARPAHGVRRVKVTRLESLHADAGQRNFDFLKISTDEGLVGWSEYNESFGGPGVSAVIDGLAPLVVGRDPRAWEALVTLLSAVRRQAAGGLVQQAVRPIQDALLDLTAKALGVPVYALFGGPVRDRIRLYWSHCGTYRLPWGPGMQN